MMKNRREIWQILALVTDLISFLPYSHITISSTNVKILFNTSIISLQLKIHSLIAAISFLF